MITEAWLEFVIYGMLGLLSLLLWWAVLENLLTRSYSVREALFGPSPNVAVAWDLLGGFCAIGLVASSIISGEALANLWLDVEYTALILLGTVALLAGLRLLLAGLLRVWFYGSLDAQGQRISINNELFVQRNLATGVFSATMYLMLAMSLLELDPVALVAGVWLSLWNLLGVWFVGLLLIVLHSLTCLGLGPREHLLRESFHENNPAAPCSFSGLLAGTLLTFHALTTQLGSAAHAWQSAELWWLLALEVVSVLIMRGLLQLALRVLLGVRLREELLQRRNLAWGVLDGGLMFGFALIFQAVLL